MAVLGEPRWTLTGLPANIVLVIEIGFLLLGFAGSLMVIYGLAEDDSPRAAHAGIHSLGDSQPDSLGRIDVADVSAHGNARHADEWISGSRVWGGHSCPTPLQLIWIRIAVIASGPLMNRQTIARKIGFGLAWPAALALPVPARAHNGPPFPIIENQKVGPCVISLWTHPDVGTGTFFVFVDPLPGSNDSRGSEDSDRRSTGERTPAGSGLHRRARMTAEASCNYKHSGRVRSRRVLAGAPGARKFAGPR